MKTAPTEKRKWATRKPAAHNEDQHGLLAVMAVGCWLRVGPLAVERMDGYGKATALARERPGAGADRPRGERTGRRPGPGRPTSEAGEARSANWPASEAATRLRPHDRYRGKRRVGGRGLTVNERSE